MQLMWFRATDNILNDDLYVRNVGYFCSKCGIIVFSGQWELCYTSHFEANQKGGAQSGAVRGAVSGCTGLLWQRQRGAGLSLPGAIPGVTSSPSPR